MESEHKRVEKIYSLQGRIRGKKKKKKRNKRLNVQQRLLKAI